MTSPLLQQPYVIDLIVSQRVSSQRRCARQHCFCNIMLLATLLQVVDYTISYELTGLSVFLHLMIDIVV